jgi:hypothetical protein
MRSILCAGMFEVQRIEHLHIGDEIYMDPLAESILALHTRLIVSFCIPITASALCDAVEGTRYILNF